MLMKTSTCVKIKLCHDAVKTDGVKCAILRATLSQGRIFHCEKRHTNVTEAVFERGDILMAGEDL